MQKLVINVLVVIIISIFTLSFATAPEQPSNPGSDCDADTSKLAVVELTVLGMDSITINDVQDRLDETCGVSFNFACWTDTVVFIEFDSTLTNKFNLMSVIAEMGYKPRVRLEY